MTGIKQKRSVVRRSFRGEGGIAFGVPVGWEPAATPRIELENPPAFAGAVFLCLKLTEIHFDAPRA